MKKCYIFFTFLEKNPYKASKNTDFFPKKFVCKVFLSKQHLIHFFIFEGLTEFLKAVVVFFFKPSFLQN